MAVEPAQGSSPRNYVEIVFGGDIMLDGLPGQAIANGEDPFAHVADILRGADIAVGNLECVVATGGQPVEKPFVFRAHPRVLPVLAQHFRVVSLANNHTGDFGHTAFLEQLLLLERQSLPYFGGGENCARARMPAIIERGGLRIALLGYNDFMPRSFEAGPSWPGVAWAVGHQIMADIRAARSQHQADIVIPFMHWGDEHEPANERQKSLARRMLASGADLVVGAHPHVTQEVERHEGKLALYSLGNFVFDGFKDGPARTGWLLRARFDKQGLIAWDTVVLQIDERGIPHICRDIPSPSGSRTSDQIELRRALVDSPLCAPATK
ncbi:MAG TPA: CapA family protein [Pirellulaceae bacterium]